MRLHDQLEFLRMANRELPPQRDFRIGAMSLFLSIAALALAASWFSLATVAATLVALSVAIVKLAEASVQARKIVRARGALHFAE